LYKIIKSSTDNKEIAILISNEILKHKYSPCIQILNSTISIYKWKNKIVNDKEFIIQIKTKSENIQNITKVIRKHHNYDNPEIISFDFDIHSDKYKIWFEENTI